MPYLAVDIPTTTNTTKRINLNTDIQFAVEVGATGGVPKTCTSILDAAKDGKASFLETYKVNQLKDQFTSLQNQLADPSLDLTKDVEQVRLQEYLERVDTTLLPVLRLVKSCLVEDLQVDQKSLKEAQIRYETSKARFESIDEDHEQVGYYESWFPLERYVKENNLFLLFGISIFLIISSILSFMSLAGVELKFILPSLDTSYNSSGFSLFDTSDFYKYALGGIVVGVLYTIIGLWRKWF